MKRYLLILLIGILLCVLSQVYISLWWFFAVITFLVSLFAKYNTATQSFMAGLLIVFISWLSLYFFYDTANDALLSNKMATLFSLKNNIWLFFIVSATMGLIGGSTSLAAYFLRKK